MNDARRIDNFLRQHHSPLAGLGSRFVAAGKRYKIDPGLLVAISGAESSYATTHLSGKNNPFGWGPGKNFGTFAQAIDTIAAGLRKGYFNQGLTTIEKIGGKWAPVGAGNDPTNLNSNWVKNVSAAYRDLSGGGYSGGSAQQTPFAGNVTELSAPPDLSSVAFENLNSISSHRYNPPAQQLSALTQIVAAAPSLSPSATENTPAVTTHAGKVTLAKGADRPGVHTSQAVLNFVSQIAGLYGQPLTISTGTNHNQFVIGTKRQSAHWTGRAADILASGAALTRLGRTALVAAGMDPAKARKVKGGLFNIGHYQIIFNSTIGGNHYNHLHVGLR